MKILVDARVMKGTITGIGRYSLNLYKALLNLNKCEKIFFYNGIGVDEHFPYSETSIEKAKTSNSKLDCIKFLIDKNLPLLTLAKKKIYLAKAERLLQNSIAKCNPSIYHSPNFFTLLNKCPVPEFITVHDISCFRYPDTHPESRVKFFEENLPKSLEKSAHILTVSDFSKQELMDYFGVKSDKISVTYNGVSDAFRPIDKNQISAFIKKYSLEYKKYFLYTGTIEPRKNLNLLIDIYTKYFQNSKLKSYKLVIAGGLGWKYSHFEQKLAQSPAKSNIVLTGYIPGHDLPKLMSGAFCFLYPSFYEGFGIPPIEAMASGVPVITSNKTSLPEVVGNAGITLHPEDIEGWFNSMSQLIEDQKLYHTYVELGLARKQSFTWEQCAQKTFNSFNTYKKS